MGGVEQKIKINVKVGGIKIFSQFIFSSGLILIFVKRLYLLNSNKRVALLIALALISILGEIL